MIRVLICFILVSCSGASQVPSTSESTAIDNGSEYIIDTIADDGSVFEGNLLLPEMMYEAEFQRLLEEIDRVNFLDYDKVMLDVYVDTLNDEGYWALLRLRPNRSYTFYRPTKEELDELMSYNFPSADSSEVIGEWISERNILTLFRKDEKTLLRIASLKGEVLDEYEVHQKGNLYFDPEIPEDSFVILESGDLKEMSEDQEEDILVIPSLEKVLNQKR